MKIGVVANHRRPTDGGSFSLQSLILSELNTAQTKHEFLILDQAEQTDRIEGDGTPLLGVQHAGLNPQSDSPHLETPLAQAVKTHHLDAVWFLSPNAELLPCPIFVTVWDLQHRLTPWFPEVSQSGWIWKDREDHYQRVLPQATRVITGTQAGKDELIQFYRLPPGNVEIVPFPVAKSPTAASEETEVSVREKYGIQNDYFIYPAQFWPHKNHVNLLHALAIIKSKDPSVPNLILTGSDKGNWNYVEAKARDLGVDKYVRYLGFIPKDDLNCLYQGAMALVFPTFFGPDNLPPLEAFANGCPVIASNISGSEEQLGDAVISFNPSKSEELAEAMLRVFHDVSLRNTLRQRGYGRVSKLTPSNYVERMCSILDEFEPVRRCWRWDYVHTFETPEIAGIPETPEIHESPELPETPESISNHANNTVSPMAKQINTIAVDLTPLLPSGENGGAKIFTLELLCSLAAIAPQTQFVLLTQAASHVELSAFDRPNVRRLIVLGSVVANSHRLRLRGLASRVLPHLPAWLRSIVSRLGYKLNTTLKQGSSGSLLRDMSVDLLFCPFTAPTYSEYGIPTVCTIYDLQYKTYPEFFAAEDLAHRDHTFTEACRMATTLTAISDYSRDSAIIHGNLNPSRIRTIYPRMAQRIAPGVESDKGVLARLGLIPQQYLIYPANFWKHKNHEILLTAFGMACHGKLAADIKLVCTGVMGARQEWLMSAAHTMNLSDRALFPGYLQTAELTALMANCAGMVFPSLYEGFGLPLIEAMAAGIPVACSNTTSLPEVAADAAILFNPCVPTQIVQAMLSLMENKALCARLIQTGQYRATNFSDTASMATEYMEIFQHAVASQKHENLLTGAYADGWAGRTLNIQVAPAASALTLEIEFLAPEWLPQQCLTAEIRQDGKIQGDPIVFNRGTNAVLSLPMEPTGGYYEVRIAPTFMPDRSGHGDDQRELSAMLQRCGIVHADGEYVELFPEKFPA
jgi:glycosyltransferase involved in cell wall biosynthesis